MRTFVVKRYDKCTGQRAREIEIYVSPPIVRHVTLLNNTLLLQILMCELIRPQNLMFLCFPLGALALASNIMQVTLVRLELVD